MKEMVMLVHQEVAVEKPLKLALAAFQFPDTVAVGVDPPGHAINLNWIKPAGADRAEIDEASLVIEPASVSESLGQLTMKSDGLHKIVDIPGAERLVELNLVGLARRGAGGKWVTMRTSRELADAGLRLVIAFSDPNVGWTTIYTVPSVPARGGLPKMFVGATFTGNQRLALPGEVSEPKLRLSLASNNNPEDFNFEEMKLDRVTAQAKIPSRDLELVDPDGQPVWAFPGDFLPGMPAAAVDLRAPMELALATAIEEERPLDLTYRLRGAGSGRAGIWLRGPKGALSRTFAGNIRSELSGGPQPLALDDQLQGAPLVAEQAAAATADLALSYAGIRILERVSDALPPASGGLSGQVVTDEPTKRAFPAGALVDRPIARIGVIGRAPEACQLSAQLAENAAAGDGNVTGEAIGPPGVIDVEPGDRIEIHWIVLPESCIPAGPVCLSLRANKGRFLWVKGPHPLARIAIEDPDPGGRPLRLNGQTLVKVTESEMNFPAKALNPAAFRSSPPILDSSLFLTVDIADLTLRYQR